jgi:hypothetical protein
VGNKCFQQGSGGTGGGGNDLAEPDLSVPRDDAATPPPDLTGVILDMVPPPDSGGCDTASRVCLDQTHSAACINGFPVPDRTCPPTSTCLNGSCQPPMGAKACNHTTGVCDNGTVCIGYNAGGALKGACTPPIVGSTLGEQQPCAAAGYDDKCQTGLCASVGTKRICGFPCTAVGQCSTAGGTPTCTFIAAPAAIEGVGITNIKVCTPP